MNEPLERTPEQVRRRLVERSLEDENLRRRLLDDPKATLESELGVSLPQEIEVRVVEETAQVVYLVLPPAARSVDAASGELSDDELESVSGGGWLSPKPGPPTDAADPDCVAQG